MADESAHTDDTQTAPAPIPARRRGRSRTIDLGPEPESSDADGLDAEPASAADRSAARSGVPDDADVADEADATGDVDDDMRRFLDRRRPWLHPITERDRRRRLGAIYWAFVYVLLMAGVSSVVSFVAVRGYLFLAPSATATGADVARVIVPWVIVAVYLGFAGYVTRSWRRTLLYLGLFLSPVVLVVALTQVATVLEWLVSWIPVPGPMRFWGLVFFLPLLAIVLLGRDFVRWQLWVEYPDDTCWECGTRIADDRWVYCPTCANDLQLQRLATAEAEAARGLPGDDDTDAVRPPLLVDESDAAADQAHNTAGSGRR